VNIITERVNPPIPVGTYQPWHAIREGYEPGEPMGWGNTEEEAIADLLEQEESRS
jgi:hypothetical protein